MRHRIPYKRGGDETPRRPIPYRRELPVPTSPPTAWLRLAGSREALRSWAAKEVLQAACSTSYPLALEIVATPEAIQTGVRCESWQAPEVASALRVVPDLEVELVSPSIPISASLALEGTVERASRPEYLPLRDVEDFGRVDPTSGLLEAVFPLGQGEGALFRFLIRPVPEARRLRAERELTQPAPIGGVLGIACSLLDLGPRIPRFEPPLYRRLHDRLGETAVEVAVAVTLFGGEQAALARRARSVTASFLSTFDGGHGGIWLDSWRWRSGYFPDSSTWPEETVSLYATIGEVAAMWHALSDAVGVPGVSYVRRVRSPLPPQVSRTRGVLLGEHHERGTKLPVSLPLADLDAVPMTVLGESGMGKSTLLLRIAGQVAAAPGRPSVVFLDPPGDGVPLVVSHGIPPSREEDVVLLEMGDVDYPVSMSPILRMPGVPREVKVEITFSLLRNAVANDRWISQQIENALFALVSTLYEVPGASLLDAYRIFSDAAFRRPALASLDDPTVQEFWGTYDRSSERDQQEQARKVISRLQVIFRSPALRNILCQGRGIDLGEFIDQGKIILVNLEGTAIQSGAKLLGELIIAGMRTVAMARLEHSPESRRRTYAMWDESQRFDGPNLPFLLRESRKVAITNVVATQYSRAWGEAMAESVLGNLGNLVVFRCGPTDARQLADSLRPFDHEAIQSLDRHEALARLQIDGATMPAFDFRALKIDETIDEARLATTRANSRRLYARPRQEVEEEIAKRMKHTPSQIQRGFDVDEE